MNWPTAIFLSTVVICLAAIWINNGRWDVYVKLRRIEEILDRKLK